MNKTNTVGGLTIHFNLKIKMVHCIRHKSLESCDWAHSPDRSWELRKRPKLLKLAGDIIGDIDMLPVRP